MLDFLHKNEITKVDKYCSHIQIYILSQNNKPPQQINPSLWKASAQSCSNTDNPSSTQFKRANISQGLTFFLRHISISKDRGKGV